MGWYAIEKNEREYMYSDSELEEDDGALARRLQREWEEEENR